MFLLVLHVLLTISGVLSLGLLVWMLLEMNRAGPRRKRHYRKPMRSRPAKWVHKTKTREERRG